MWLRVWERSRVGEAVVHPAPKLFDCCECLDVHAQRAVHLPAAHLKTAHVRLLDQGVGMEGIDAQQQAAPDCWR